MVLKHLYFYTSTQVPLQTTCRHFCTESVEFLLRITQILLHRQLVQTNIYFYTHTESFTHRGFLHTCFYADALTQRAFAHRELLHTKPIPHANNLLDAGAFTHKTFCTRKLPTPVRRKNIPLLPPFSGSTRVSFREYGQ